MTRIRVPADLDRVSIQLLGRFSLKDLARFGVPTAVTAGPVYLDTVVLGNQPSISAVAAAVIGAVLGTVWALVRIEGESLDAHCFNAIRFYSGRVTGRIAGIQETGEAFVETGAGTYSGVVEVESVNLDLKTGSERKAVYETYSSLFQSVSFPVEIHSRQNRFSLESYIGSLSYPSPDYIDHLQGLAGDGLCSTRHLAVVHASERDELENRISQVLGGLNPGALSAERVTGERLRELFDEETVEFGARYTERVDSSEKRVSRTLYVSELPRETRFTWPVDVLQVDGLVDVVQVIEPQESSEALESLRRTGEKADAELQSLIRSGYGSSSYLQRVQEDVNWFRDLLTDRRDQPVRYGAYITVYGRSEEEADAAVREVRNRVPSFQLREPLFRADDGYRSTSLAHRDGLDEKLLMPARSAGAGFPFTTPGTVEDGGILYGRDYSTGYPVILNPFSWSAGHTVLAGATGSGKSYAAKLLLVRSTSVYQDLHVDIVDPKDEYGSVHEVLEDSGSVNRYSPDDVAADNTEKLTEAVRLAYRDALDTDRKTIVLVDEAHRLLKDEQGCSVLSTLVREARASNTAVVLVTQAVGDFYRQESGPDILKNTPCKVLFAHESADEDPVKRFRLSNREESELYRLAKGDEDSNGHSDAILAVSNRLESKVRVEASPVEHGVIDDGVVPEIQENTIGDSRENVADLPVVVDEERSLKPSPQGNGKAPVESGSHGLLLKAFASAFTVFGIGLIGFGPFAAAYIIADQALIVLPVDGEMLVAVLAVVLYFLVFRWLDPGKEVDPV